MAIIKFKTRKNIYSGKQLVNYILTDKGRIENSLEAPILLQNINHLDLDTMHLDFLENYKFQPKRKGSTAIYHEIISISPLDKEKVTIEMLQDLMETYIKMRKAENAIVICKGHLHDDNQHFHCMISGTELRSKKRLRMSQKEMKTLLQNFENYHKDKYPQLENSIIHTIKPSQISRDIAKENRNYRREKEHQLKQRICDNKTQKEVVAKMVNELLQQVGNFTQLVKHIEETDSLAVYSFRSQIRGVLYHSRKWRFSTLGVSKEKIQQLEKVQDRLKQLSLIREMHKPTREKEFER